MVMVGLWWRWDGGGGGEVLVLVTGRVQSALSCIEIVAAVIMFKLTKDSCRRCGRNTHATASCPNVASDSFVRTPLAAAAAASAAKVAADAAKRAAAQEAKRATKNAKRAAKEAERAVKIAAFERLDPFDVEIRNWSCFQGTNWAVEAVNLCKKCGKPEPKNGCWCMPHKV